SRTPLHHACINGHTDVVRFLLRKNCDLNPQKNRDVGSDSFFVSCFQAEEHQHRDRVSLLFESGASHGLRDAGGNSALHSAVMISSRSLLKLLLEYGADINVKNELGYTPLVLAITECRTDMIEFLLHKGADVNAED
ncbi:ANKR7 protein, partial [Furnarius figulus]|nr:ANKR7 protein [Furnarius figulus]